MLSSLTAPFSDQNNSIPHHCPLKMIVNDISEPLSSTNHGSRSPDTCYQHSQFIKSCPKNVIPQRVSFQRGRARSRQLQRALRFVLLATMPHWGSTRAYLYRMQAMFRWRGLGLAPRTVLNHKTLMRKKRFKGSLERWEGKLTVRDEGMRGEGGILGSLFFLWGILHSPGIYCYIRSCIGYGEIAYINQ